MGAGQWASVVAAVVLSTTLPAISGSSSNTKKALVTAANEVIATCGERNQINVFLEKTADMTVAAAHKTQPNLTEDQWAQFRTIVRNDLISKTDTYLALVTADYATHLSASDMHAIVVFCQTPAGRKLSSARSQMERDTFDARQAWLHSAILAAFQDAQQRILTGTYRP